MKDTSIAVVIILCCIGLFSLGAVTENNRLEASQEKALLAQAKVHDDLMIVLVDRSVIALEEAKKALVQEKKSTMDRLYRVCTKGEIIYKVTTDDGNVHSFACVFVSSSSNPPRKPTLENRI